MAVVGSRLVAPFRRSLRARLVASFLALSTVTVVLVGGIVYVRATGDLTASVYERLEAVADIKADALDRWIDEQIRNVVFIGVVPGVGDDAAVFLDHAADASSRAAAETRLRQLLATFVAQTADAEEIFIVGLDGTIRLSTLATHEAQSVASEEFVRTGSSHTFVQNVYRSSLTSRPTITIATPLFDQDGKGQRVAIVAANLSLQRVDRIVQERTGLGESGQTLLVGADRGVIQGTTQTNNELDTDAADGIAAGQSGRGLYLNSQGVPVIGVYTWLPDRNAGLIAEMAQEEALGSARQLAITIGLVGLASAIVLAAAIWIVARRITRPILSLAATATRVQGGDLEAVSGIRSDDEVGALASAFDDMTRELRENVETLERRVAERTAELSDALGEVGRQKQYFESLVDVSPVAVVTMDLEERVSGWNPAAEALFGYAAAEAVGRSIDDLILRSDALREQGQGIAAEAAAEGRAQRAAHRMRKDGSLVDVDVLMVPLIVDGEQIGFYAIYHDISELVAARRAADAANQAKSAFLAAMSHEIRTPMNAVIGMGGLLLRTDLTVEQRDFAESISTSAEALLTIINDILDFSKIEAGRLELDTAPYDLAATVRATVELVRPLAAQKGLTLELEVEGEPPRLLGDPGRLRQIVLNLLSNALKFTERGGVDVRLVATPDPTATGPNHSDDRWQVRVEVRDSGIGISPEAMGGLFQSFSQADASISRRYGGTGLGLAISRRLAELMGGSLTAESSGVVGEGSRFVLAFPAAPAPADAVGEAIAGAAAAPASWTGGAAGGAVPSASTDGAPDASLRILLAEDNLMNRKVALKLLETMGLSADIAVNGLEVLQATARSPYDVILMDVEMPDLDGLETTRRLRAADSAHRPWIVAMTASAMEGDRETCLAAGMDDYVSKPVRAEALHAALVAASASRVAGGDARRPAEAGGTDG